MTQLLKGSLHCDLYQARILLSMNSKWGYIVIGMTVLPSIRAAFLPFDRIWVPISILLILHTPLNGIYWYFHIIKIVHLCISYLAFRLTIAGVCVLLLYYLAITADCIWLLSIWYSCAKKSQKQKLIQWSNNDFSGFKILTPLTNMFSNRRNGTMHFFTWIFTKF